LHPKSRDNATGDRLLLCSFEHLLEVADDLLGHREREDEFRSNHDQFRRQSLEQPPDALVLDQAPEDRPPRFRRIERPILNPRLDDVEGLGHRYGRRGPDAGCDGVLRPRRAGPVLPHPHERLRRGIPPEEGEAAGGISHGRRGRAAVQAESLLREDADNPTSLELFGRGLGLHFQRVQRQEDDLFFFFLQYTRAQMRGAGASRIGISLSVARCLISETEGSFRRRNVCILTFADPDERPARGREERSSEFVSEAIVEVRAEPLRHYVQYDRLAAEFVDALQHGEKGDSEEGDTHVADGEERMVWGGRSGACSSRLFVRGIGARYFSGRDPPVARPPYMNPCDDITHLENFIRGTETDPGKETHGLPADALGGGIAKDGEVEIRCRLRGRTERDELRFAGVFDRAERGGETLWTYSTTWRW
jgi:hypothetical protein